VTFIPRQAKSPARVAISCKLPADIGRLLKQYAEFLDSSQEHILSETLRVAFRRDKEFQAWLTKKNVGGTDSGTSAPTSSSLAQHSVDSVSKAAASARPALRRNIE
jgi:hypothetical protein